MTYNPKLHKKLTKPKQAQVSLDSLLGLLSSAYGTEQIDSADVFQGNQINWQNLSVENFKSAPRKQVSEEEKEKKVKIEQSKSTVGTSTTSLKPSKSEGDVDVTLVSIRSLEHFKQLKDNSQEEEIRDSNNGEVVSGTQEFEDKVEPKDNLLSKTSEKEEAVSEMDVQKGIGDSLENQDTEVDQRKVISGIYIDDFNGKLVFDVKFMKKIEMNEEIALFPINEPDLSVSIVDISKRTKALIKVNKECLVSKSKYFENIDNELGLENLDVAVKCNLGVFHWIVQWIQADILMCKPNLNDSNLKTVLVIAHNLKIDQLVQECLCYFHMNCKSILETDWDIVDVLDDDLILQLVVKFTRADIDGINDFFDNFKSRLYCALIRLLGEQRSSLVDGHYSTLATLFKCDLCDKLFHFDMANSIPCRSDCNQINFKGELVPYHEQYSQWGLSKYIELMYKELGCWKTVYWRLWGKCHFMNCSDCKIEFPLEQNDWCSYHPEGVDYFSINSQESHPIGTYKCCGEVAYRFNVLKPYSGCKFKPHSPVLDTETKLNTYKAFQCYKHLITLQVPENSVPKKFVKLVKKGDILKSNAELEQFWWSGIRLAPKEKQDYSLISQAVLNKLRNKPEEIKHQPKEKQIVYEPPIAIGIMPVTFFSNIVSESTNLQVPASELLSAKNKKGKQKGGLKKGKSSNSGSPGQLRQKKKKLPCTYQPTKYFWMSSNPSKDNQDIQRDYEEIAMRTLVKMLSPDDNSISSLEPSAGTYIRLEADWWREHSGDVNMAGTSKQSGTVVNRTYPLSWFRKLNILQTQ